MQVLGMWTENDPTAVLLSRVPSSRSTLSPYFLSQSPAVSLEMPDLSVSAQCTDAITQSPYPVSTQRLYWFLRLEVPASDSCNYCKGDENRAATVLTFRDFS